jgi:hypothetical protein
MKTPILALGVAPFTDAALSETTQTMRDEAREIFTRVIGFQTSLGLNHLPAMAAYLADKFRAAGFPQSDIHVFRRAKQPRSSCATVATEPAVVRSSC